ncbi:hypothetical protein, partial [Falsibacillus albus]
LSPEVMDKKRLVMDKSAKVMDKSPEVSEKLSLVMETPQIEKKSLIQGDIQGDRHHPENGWCLSPFPPLKIFPPG